MADIKQAAKWINEGKKVRRPSFGKEESFHGYMKCVSSGADFWIGYFNEKEGSLHGSPSLYDHDLLTTGDLLADDWEIAS